MMTYTIISCSSTSSCIKGRPFVAFTEIGQQHETDERIEFPWSHVKETCHATPEFPMSSSSSILSPQHHEDIVKRCALLMGQENDTRVVDELEIDGCRDCHCGP